MALFFFFFFAIFPHVYSNETTYSVHSRRTSTKYEEEKDQRSKITPSPASESKATSRHLAAVRDSFFPIEDAAVPLRRAAPELLTMNDRGSAPRTQPFLLAAAAVDAAAERGRRTRSVRDQIHRSQIWPRAEPGKSADFRAPRRRARDGEAPRSAAAGGEPRRRQKPHQQRRRLRSTAGRTPHERYPMYTP